MVTKNSPYLWPWCYNFLFDVSSTMKACSTCSTSTKRVRGVVHWTDGGHSIPDHGRRRVHVLLTRGAVRRAIKQREVVTCKAMAG